jgi:hypothetical protein
MAKNGRSPGPVRTRGRRGQCRGDVLAELQLAGLPLPLGELLRWLAVHGLPWRPKDVSTALCDMMDQGTVRLVRTASGGNAYAIAERAGQGMGLPRRVSAENRRRGPC